MYGRDGSDQIWGGGGSDFVAPDSGRDWVYLGAGDDKAALASDGQIDYIDCGPGTDTVVTSPGPDPMDLHVHCEDVSFVPPVGSGAAS
jgi:RTX calcium-binding nonapeptide repeat (4 copies)